MIAYFYSAKITGKWGNELLVSDVCEIEHTSLSHKEVLNKIEKLLYNWLPDDEVVKVFIYSFNVLN